MKRCQTCIFWNQDSADNPFANNNIGKCFSKKLNDNDYNDIEFRKANKEDMLIYEYHEAGMFFTGKDFGCVHHQKEVENEQANKKEET